MKQRREEEKWNPRVKMGSISPGRPQARLWGVSLCVSCLTGLPHIFITVDLEARFEELFGTVVEAAW